MTLFAIAMLIISAITLVVATKRLTEARVIKVDKETKQREVRELESELHTLYDRRTKLIQDIQREKEQIEQLYESEKNQISEQIKLYKQSTLFANNEYISLLEQKAEAAEKRHDARLKELHKKEEEILAEIETLKNSLSAGMQASLREKEKKDKLDFYKLLVSATELDDIERLTAIKPSLHQPVILSKLIWSTYFQKQTNELCNRVLGTDKICGIYKITSLNTEQCYIGQSVDIAQRWKDHIKCGLGIEAPATNKLYNAMQKEGVWNFTFELIEACPREQLNDKEKFWIDTYQSNKFGLNVTKGGS